MFRYSKFRLTRTGRGSLRAAKRWSKALERSDGGVVLDLDGFKDHVFSVAFSPDGTRILVTDVFALHVRDASTGKPQLELDAERTMFERSLQPGRRLHRGLQRKPDKSVGCQNWNGPA